MKRLFTSMILAGAMVCSMIPSGNLAVAKEAKASVSLITTVTTGNDVTSLTYNSKGLLTKTVKKNKNTTVQTEAYTYNKKNQLIKTVRKGKNEDGVPMTTTYTCSYNKKGLRTSGVYHCVEKGVQEETRKRTYSFKNGQVVSIKQDETIKHLDFGDVTKYLVTHKYTYDKNGNIIKDLPTRKYVTGDGDTHTFNYVYIYDKHQNIATRKIRATHGMDYKYDVTYTYTYSKGLPTKRVEKSVTAYDGESYPYNGTTHFKYTSKKIPKKYKAQVSNQQGDLLGNLKFALNCD